MREEKKIRIGLFAGTTEGRLIAGRIAGMEGILLDIFVATEYGKVGLPAKEQVQVFCGRLDEKEIFEALEHNRYDLVIDATHPYARLVSENIKEACGRAEIRCMRVLRDPGCRAAAAGAQMILADSVEEAVEFLRGTEGAVLVTTGSKELYKYKELPDWENRIFARVLSLPQVVSACAELGFYGAHLIAMQGPFSVEMNLALLESTKARWMVTKESGKAGGFEEKEEAAMRAGIGLIVIGRPKEDGISLSETLAYLDSAFGDVAGGLDQAKKELENAERELPEKTAAEGVGSGQTAAGRTRVFLIGAGLGSLGLLTAEAQKALKDCQLLVGARRILQELSVFKKPVLAEYEPEKILEFLKCHPEYKNVCVALSGDTGFYSGAKKLAERLKKEPEIETSVLPGISSVNYFFSKIGDSWEDARLISLHGRDADLVKEVKTHGKVFVLAGGTGTLGEICSRLLEAGLAHTALTVGENLSMPEETIFCGTPRELRDRETAALAVVLVRNPRPEEETDGGFRPDDGVITHGLSDEEFLRDRVPMTKMEVRTVSISKLMLTRNAVVYDVGAGTGSVSVECARLSPGIKVYAIERKEDAVGLLRENKKKFGLSNMEIVEGAAPEAMEGLPAPTHVFIGGSGGKMRQVVTAALSKNPSARFVVNLITLESMAAVMEILQSEPVKDAEIVQLTAARSKKAGSSHLMMGQNPVWIAAFTGEARKDV